MRIVAGAYKGVRLASVGKGDAAAHLRPTADRVRESLFNVLAGGHFGDPVTDARVLDLFAGTGALGLEALSRGAHHVTFVDDGAKAGALIRENVDLTRSRGQTRLYRRDATRLGDVQGPPFNLLFLDPPYGQPLGARALASAAQGGWLAQGALVVWEDAAPHPAPDGFTALNGRRYGDTHITFVRYGSGTA